jgi:hypothetical protein
MCLRGWERERWFADSTTLRRAGQGFLPRVFTEGREWFLFYPYNPWLMFFSAAQGAKPRVASLWDNQAVDLHCIHYTRA